MQSVGSGFDREISDGSLSAVVLGAHCAFLQFELANRLCGGAEFVVVASGKIGPADGNALNQDLVRVLLPTVNRSRKGTAGCPGQA